MDGIANVAKQQQTQLSTQPSISDVKIQTVATNQQAQQPLHQNSALQNNSVDSTTQQTSKKDVETLVEKLNDALEPLNTSIKFGVDNDNVFYVSVIEEKTHKVIRRFPAKEAQSLLPKMEEVTGILFDSKG